MDRAQHAEHELPHQDLQPRRSHDLRRERRSVYHPRSSEAEAAAEPCPGYESDGTGTKKVNTVTWQVNPENGGLTLKNYRIYRKSSSQADSSFAFFAAASGTALQYEDTSLEVLQKYAYRVTALSMNDDESDPSGTVTETKKFEFPPLNVAVQTGFNKIVFFQLKINTVTLAKNTLNDDAEGERIQDLQAQV